MELINNNLRKDIIIAVLVLVFLLLPSVSFAAADDEADVSGTSKMFCSISGFFSGLFDDVWDVVGLSVDDVTGESTPQVAGTSETHTVTGLTSETAYYFAIKTSDEVPNISNLSNVDGSGSVYAYYYIPISTTTVDGDKFCGGSACTSADTIIIEGGARGSLRFQNFNGAGSYITITNQNTDPDSKVEITGNGVDSSSKILSLYNCKYVDLRGDNDGDITYGIKVINDGTPASAHTVWVYGESDHIKLSYLEVAFDGNLTVPGVGIHVGDADLTTAWTFDTFEIHHNHIHDSTYCGMYLGHNNPAVNNNPYVGTFSIHDNILEDLGSYGITYKGINGPNNYIYNNTVKKTGLVPEALGDNFFHGIGVQYIYGDNYVEIYNNWIEKTVGPGLKIGGNKHLVYNNVIAGCGSGNDTTWGHGIFTFSAKDVELYDNIIIQAKRYGIYGGYNVTSVSHKRNLIGDSGIGEAGGNNLVEGTGADANIYHADVADFGFNVWSDDGDYSNDDFSFGDTTPPIRSNPQPNDTLDVGTTSTNISLTTSINATCRYSNTSNTNYTDMMGTFTNTNSTNHSTEVSGLENGKTYIYFVRCNSTDSYVNNDDWNITFSIAGHKADTNNDNQIDMLELMAFISRWKANDNVTRAEVEEARGIWFSGGVY